MEEKTPPMQYYKLNSEAFLNLMNSSKNANVFIRKRNSIKETDLFIDTSIDMCIIIKKKSNSEIVQIIMIPQNIVYKEDEKLSLKNIFNQVKEHQEISSMYLMREYSRIYLEISDFFLIETDLVNEKENCFSSFYLDIGRIEKFIPGKLIDEKEYKNIKVKNLFE